MSQILLIADNKCFPIALEEASKSHSETLYIDILVNLFQDEKDCKLPT